MAKIFEVRYKENNIIVAHQHASEHFAKIDAKQLSKSHGRSLLGEMDYEANSLIRVCEYAGGIQGKWQNREGPISIVKILLSCDDTKQDESAIEALPRPEISEEEKQKKKEMLARIREAAEKKNEASNKGSTGSSSKSENKDERKTKLVSQGHESALAEIICKANVHEGSPNFNALVALWKGRVTQADFPKLKPKDLNSLMLKLRALLIANETEKAIATIGNGATMAYKLVDYKLEIEEVA